MRHDRHYGNLYADVIEYARARGRVSAAEVAEAFAHRTKYGRHYLERGLKRGHLTRPERGIYSATESGPTNHEHESCGCEQVTATQSDLERRVALLERALGIATPPTQPITEPMEGEL